ncbi:tryptophan halogenase family protein [Gilvimarinus sp. 1_MG-2023]|uniref:tryptophan halogenase family protein n=1 Tax=Gilvimarinus sp. 1_MG-2023 TaxID=3062638 RepID=UPI0026E438D5|nr:tryptophan halogenase family protein [Gilvimarinus sp. 1_MG-2023]MDO6746771.1 tryptophan 7-halogenase [Gilvimarinus sp. 1_MG-2023]
MQLKKIVIVGGGAAGWMSACLMAQQWRGDIAITLVESSAIGTVGVGEGSTPFLRDFFQTLNIPEDEWMPACNATYKCGIRFPGWSSREDFASYFHPFNTELDQSGAIQFFKDCYARRMGYDLTPVPDDYFAASAIAKMGRAPFARMSDGSVQVATDYGYHFDSHLLGEFLKQHAKRLGVVHIDDKVVDVKCTEAGGIDSVQLAQSGRLAGDFFVDCTGFKSLLMREALAVPFISCQDRLSNNAAVALPARYAEDKAQKSAQPQARFPTETIAQAMPYGWMWRIPLTQRWGNGYVFDRNYADFDQIEAQLREQLGSACDDFSARRIMWEPGRLQHHWEKNCIAIGLSQGFLEPLEAPMLRIIQFTCERFVELYQSDGLSGRAQQRFNQSVNQLIDGNIDYLQAHYLVSSRTDTAYWKTVQNNQVMSPELARLLRAWRSKESFDSVLSELSDALVYHKTSWYCLLAGKGEFNLPTKQAPASAHAPKQRLKEYNAKGAQNCLLTEGG